jgi:substrate import-associated zinc metallohydrolase lipoprotein
MKKIKYFISALLLVAVTAMTFSSCSEDKLGPTIFPDVDETLDPNSYTYKLDKFLKVNYLDKYNLTFLYKMPDISTNMNYNLVPAEYNNAIDLAVLCKHLWFDVYDKVAGEDFLKTYGPRIILLIGSPAINPNSGSEIVGLAEGGIKISLFKVNSMNISDFEQMNELYFHTMHHEFSHILHQTKTYPTEFNTISVGRYDANNWQYRGNEVTSLGFVTPYGSSEYREDFAETIACFIVYTDTQWNRLMELARRGYATSASDDDLDAVYYSYYYYPDNDAEQDLVYVDERFVVVVTDEDGTVHKYWRNNRDKDGNRIVVYDVIDNDGINGEEAILQKVQIARQWFRDAWNIDLDSLRSEVQTRQATYDINQLRLMVSDIQ